jgi:transcriptional regulator with XRE-family HTH domain
MRRPIPVKDIGMRVRQLREARGWTQLELADRVGISRAAITQIESGKTTDPKIGNVVALAYFFGLSLDDLLTESPTKPGLRVAEEQLKYGKDAGALSREEQVFLEKYRHLTPDDRVRMQEIVAALDAAGHKRAEDNH